MTENKMGNGDIWAEIYEEPVPFDLFTSCYSSSMGFFYGFFYATNPGKRERICEVKLKAFLSVCQGCLGGEAKRGLALKPKENSLPSACGQVL